jgi:hypothetical protein
MRFRNHSGIQKAIWGWGLWEVVEINDKKVKGRKIW